MPPERAEKSSNDAEILRATAEEGRVAAETSRSKAEGVREVSEDGRKLAEELRTTAELLRREGELHLQRIEQWNRTVISADQVEQSIAETLQRVVDALGQARREAEGLRQLATEVRRDLRQLGTEVGQDLRQLATEVRQDLLVAQQAIRDERDIRDEVRSSLRALEYTRSTESRSK
jgi:hypothetical protein